MVDHTGANGRVIFHQKIKKNIDFIIANHLIAQQGHGASNRVIMEFRLNTNLTSRERDETLPDLAVYEQPLTEDLGSMPTGTIPLLIIEILSESNKINDQITKKQKYMQLGVPYYWIIAKGESAEEVMQRSTFFKLENGQYVDQSAQFQETGQISCPALDNLVINADDVLNQDPAEQFEKQKSRADKLEKELVSLKKKLKQ